MTQMEMFPQENESINDDELPDGWAWVTIDDVIAVGDVFSDGDWVESKDQDPDGDVRLIQLADIGDGYYRDRSDRFLTKEKAIELNCTFLQSGDVLIARMPDPLGRACIFPGDKKESVTVVDVCIIRVKNIDHRYLMYAINFLGTRHQILSLQSGSTRKRISRKNLSKVFFPLAPYNEQIRIVEKIEQLFTILDAGVEALERLQKNLERYKASVLKAACEGKLVPQDPDDEPASDLLERILIERRQRWEADQLAAYQAKGKSPPKNWKDRYKEPVEPDTSDLPELPEGWIVTSMDALTARITSGSRDWKQYYDRGTGTFLMAQNIRMGLLDLSFRQAVDPPLDDSSRQRSQVEIGDLLVTIVGANTGDVAPVTLELPEHYVCQSVALMRPVENILTPWLITYLTSPENGQRQYNKYIYGAGRPHLSFDQLRATAIPLPPLSEQVSIVRKVDKQISIYEDIQSIVEVNLKRVQNLRQAILKKAFAGELVPQDPDDEPASALLKYIQSGETPPIRLDPAPTLDDSYDESERIVSDTNKRPIYDVLKEIGYISPEALLEDAGYTIDEIDLFYQALREEINADPARIEEYRDKSGDRWIRIIDENS